ncbi:MAG: hypothetical protein IRY99_15400 [Isosphaeraceae bacterium]|nr:hypothetical protein [Isosphaeraceae bacterium]
MISRRWAIPIIACLLAIAAGLGINYLKARGVKGPSPAARPQPKQAIPTSTGTKDRPWGQDAGAPTNDGRHLDGKHTGDSP